MNVVVRYPNGWHLGGSPGNIIHLAPPNESHFFIDVVFDETRSFSEASRDEEASLRIDADGGSIVGTRQQTIGGSKARVFATSYPEQSTKPIPDWCSGCVTEKYVVDWATSGILDITVQADSQAVYDRYKFTAAEIVNDLRKAA